MPLTGTSSSEGLIAQTCAGFRKIACSNSEPVNHRWQEAVISWVVWIPTQGLAHLLLCKSVVRLCLITFSWQVLACIECTQFGLLRLTIPVCLSSGCAVQKWLNGSRLCSGWRLLGTKGTLYWMAIPILLWGAERRVNGGNFAHSAVRQRGIQCSSHHITLVTCYTCFRNVQQSHIG